MRVLSEKNELGKYLGEPLIGLLAFNDLIPFKAEKIIIPVSSCFSSIDCAILTKSRDLIPISNKFGAGARASFFAHLLPRAANLKWRELAKAPVLKNLVDCHREFFKCQREIVYRYGVRHILGLGIADCPDPYSFYVRLAGSSLISGKTSSRKNTRKGTGENVGFKTHLPTNLSLGDERIINDIRNKCGNHKQILENLTPEKGYSSVTGFFTHRMASDLNNCPGSIEAVKKLLAAKSFYQANLNIPKWMKGDVEYTLAPGGKMDLVFCGNKAPFTDLTAQKGLLTYRLKME